MLDLRGVFDGEIGDIYVYEALRTFGIQLISVFIPIHIAAQGFNFKYVFGFLIISYTTSVILSLPLSYVIAKKGFKKALLVSYIFLLPALLLIRSNLNFEVIAVSAVLYSVAKILHGLAYESEFAVASHDSKRDSESGRMIGLPNIARVLGPLAGGFILSFAGFNMLVATSILFFLTSVIVIFRTQDHRDPLDYSLRQLISENITGSVPVFFFRGICNIAAVTVFALFVYYFVGGTVDVGIVSAIDNLGVILTALISGKLASRLGEGKLILAGTVLSSAIHFSRIIVSSPVEATLVSGLGGIFFMVYYVPLFSKYAEAAEDEDVLEFYALKKVFFKAGQLATVLVILLVGLEYGLQTGFTAAFAIAGVSSLFMMHFSEKDW